MSGPPALLISKRAQTVIVGLAAAALAIGGFEVGRKTVNAADVAANNNGSVTATPPPQRVSPNQTLLERNNSRITVREIATVPFSELYDVLKSASPEQLLAWAADLEQMPRGPRQYAAVAAYFKSLIQVDHRVAIEAILHAQNLHTRDHAIDAIMKAAPESIWPELAEMMAQLPYPGRGFAQDDFINNWSRVDPVAASRFVEKHRFTPGIKVPGEENDRVVSLLTNWGEIDPMAAKNWLEEDASRQTADAFRAMLTSWGHVDHAAAIDHAIANQRRPDFGPAINGLVYELVRSAKEDATRLLLLLPSDQAKAALKNVADITNPREIDPNVDVAAGYQRPAEEVARWMITLPVDLWSESIGQVVEGWLDNNVESTKAWVVQLPPEMRDATIMSLCRDNSHQVAPANVVDLVFVVSEKKFRDKALTEFARTYSDDIREGIETLKAFANSEPQKAYLDGLIAEGANGR